MPNVAIVPFEPVHKDTLIALTLAAWRPVFAKTAEDVPRFVYEAFYPDGWEARQTADVAELLETEPENIWLAVAGDKVAGFVGLRIQPEDRMGEIHILAVAPEFQRRGIGKRLMLFAEDRIRESGMQMVMVETVGDRGHAPARRAYEAFGFQQWPVARYFKEL